MYRHPGEVEDEVDGIQDEGACLLSKAALCPHHEGCQAKEYVEERPVDTMCNVVRPNIGSIRAFFTKRGLAVFWETEVSYQVGPKMGVGRFHEGLGRVLYLR